MNQQATLFDEIETPAVGPGPVRWATEARLGKTDYWWEPRPDLTADTQQWRQLLRAAYVVDGERADGLYGPLYALRCSGARLERRANGTYRLTAGAEYAGDWRADCQRWLAPHRAALVRLLAELAELAS